MAKVIIPTPLRKFTDNQRSFEAQGETVQAAIGDLAQAYPGLQKHLFTEEGSLRKFIRVFVGDTDIKSLQNEQTAVAAQTEISIIPAIAGG